MWPCWWRLTCFYSPNHPNQPAYGNFCFKNQNSASIQHIYIDSRFPRQFLIVKDFKITVSFTHNFIEKPFHHSFSDGVTFPFPPVHCLLNGQTALRFSGSSRAYHEYCTLLVHLRGLLPESHQFGPILTLLYTIKSIPMTKRRSGNGTR